jgi:Domain of unknown function (DUF4145)
MSTVSYKAPAFICPVCQVHSQQNWASAYEIKNGSAVPYHALWWATCLNCSQRTIWFQERLVAPISSSAPPPNPDMPDDIRVDFEEASDIAERSPRSAAGLLRLCIHKLCMQLGASGNNLNSDIGALVARGLPSEIQQAFDAVRIVGNSQLHPDDTGIDLRSNPSALPLLFMLVYLIVENQISLPRRTREFYDNLPENARDSVKRRTEKQQRTDT